MQEKNDPQPGEAPAPVWASVLGASVVLLIVLGLVLAAWPAALKLLWTETAAAWMQAIGAVATIGAAVWLAHEQAEREQKKRDREEEERRVRKTSIALAAVGYLRYVAKGIQKDMDRVEGNDRLAHTDVMAHRIEALRSFAERLDVTQLDNAQITRRYFGVLEAVIALDAAYIDSPQRALEATRDVLEICNRFSIDFGGSAQTIREYIYLPEFQS